MRKLLFILITAILFLGSCKKKKMVTDLKGCWVVYDSSKEGELLGSLKLNLSGFELRNNTCRAFYHGAKNYSFSEMERWKLLEKNSLNKWKLIDKCNYIKFRWGDNVAYPLSGIYRISLDKVRENKIYIDGECFVRINCNEIENYE